MTDRSLLEMIAITETVSSERNKRREKKIGKHSFRQLFPLKGRHMSYQVPQRQRASRLASSSQQPTFPWSDPAHIAANQQQVLTPQQLAMLKGKLELAPAGCVAMLSLLTIIPLFMLASVLHNEAILFLFALPLGLILLLLLLPYQKRASRVRMALTSAIVQEQGEVIWHNDKYVARTPTRLLMPADSNLDLPPPGPYHFYYLPEKAILLSADPITTYTGMLAYPGTLAASGLPGREQARIALQEALYQALDFNSYDLDCNRQRMLSQEQQHRLYRKLFWKVIGSLISLPIGGAFLVYATSLQVNSHASTDLPFVIFMYILGSLILLGALYFLLRGSRVRYREIHQSELTILNGPITTRKEEGSDETPTRYYLTINTTHLQIKEPAYKAIIPHTRYCLYYLPKMDEIVSIEPLEPPQR